MSRLGVGEPGELEKCLDSWQSWKMVMSWPQNKNDKQQKLRLLQQHQEAAWLLPWWKGVWTCAWSDTVSSCHSYCWRLPTGLKDEWIATVAGAAYMYTDISLELKILIILNVAYVRSCKKENHSESEYLCTVLKRTVRHRLLASSSFTVVCPNSLRVTVVWV